MEQLSNDRLTIAVDAKGAELQSIKDSEGREYLWQADPNYLCKKNQNQEQ